MRRKLFPYKLAFEIIRCFPHLLLFYFHKNKAIIRYDVLSWGKVYKLNYRPSICLLYLLSNFPEYRNVFYFRVGGWRHFLNIFCPKMSTLYIATNKIGKGLFIQHGFATIIAAKSIGENCWINQQVTIGYLNEFELPEIGDNVIISAGAKVIGNVYIGDNSKIGANAAVVKNVPPNCTVVGVPAYIVRKNGLRVTENL